MYLSSRIHPCPRYMAAIQQSSGGYRQPMGQQQNQNPPGNPPCTTERCQTTGQDYGPNMYVTNIDASTTANPYFRRALWTGDHLQLTEMCIGPGGEIGLEVHPDTDQFIRLEQGRGRVMAGSTMNNLDYQRNVEDNFAVFVPAGTWHNLVNTGDEPIKLYTIYAPSHHPAGTIQCTRADAEEAEQ